LTIASVGSHSEVKFYSKIQDQPRAQAATGPAIGLATGNTPSADDVLKTVETVNSDNTVGSDHRPQTYKLPGSFHV
jgi:hypothetical protein